MAQYLVLLLTLAACLFQQAFLPAGKRQVAAAKLVNDPSTSMFIDTADGRTRLLYGLSFINMIDNVVQVSDDNINIFSKQWGFNTARVRFLWNLIEIAPKQYNETYLTELGNVVDKFAANGISVILEMHQDLLSSYTCGHGLPAFYAKPYQQSKYEAGGSWTFPRPIMAPQYNASDNSDKTFPQIDNCKELFEITPLGWTEAHFTFAVMSVAQRLYDNDAGLLTAFGDMWQMMAHRFANKTNVVGYELINDPWLGNAPLSLLTIDDWKRLPYWYANHDEHVNLEPMYNYLQQRIAQEDNDTMLFFEPVVGGNFFASMPVGFSAGPGGAQNVKHQAMSYHLYCVFGDGPAPILPSWLPKFIRDWIEDHGFFNACRKIYTSSLDIREKDFKNLHVGGLLTEFGAVSLDSQDFSDVASVITDMETRLQGWLYFGLPNPETKILCPDMKFCIVGEHLELTPPELARLFARPKLLAAPGVPILTNFDNVTSVFIVEYKPSTDVNVFAQPCEIFINATEYYYNSNQPQQQYNNNSKVGAVAPFNVVITPFVEGVQSLYDSASNILSVQFDGSLVNQVNLVRIEIRPK